MFTIMDNLSQSWPQFVQKSCSTISKPCALFWDIEFISVSSGKSAQRVIKLLRDEIIRREGLTEVEFTCVSRENELSPSIKWLIKSSRVKIIKTIGNQRNAAHLKIIELIEQFVKTQGKTNGCSIGLISGDSDFAKILNKCKLNYGIKVYLIHREFHRNGALDAAADELYLLSNGRLRQVTRAIDISVIKVTIAPEVFLSQNIPSNLKDIKNIFEHLGAIKDSFLFDNCDLESPGIWIKFPNKKMAKKVARDNHYLPYHNEPLIVDYVHYPPDYVLERFTNHIDSSVQFQESLSLQLMTLGKLSSSRTSLTSSTLSLPFEAASSAYLIVTGFPDNHSPDKRCQYLSQLLDKPVDKFTATPLYVWFPVHYPFQAKYYIDKINNSNCKGFKLSATIDKQLPTAVMVDQQPSKRVIYEEKIFGHTIQFEFGPHDTVVLIVLLIFFCVIIPFIPVIIIFC